MARFEGTRFDRMRALDAGFRAAFNEAPEGFFSAPGRTELGGNHTDHQHGRVLAAAVSLDAACAIKKRRDGRIIVASEGFKPLEIRAGDIEPRADEKGTTAALVRGVAAELGLQGSEGAELYISSQVPVGSGLSSSAAFEVLLATALDGVYHGGSMGSIERAKLAQRVENRYFGKPCGLMDQTASAVGGVLAIDFADPDNPAVERIDFDLASVGYSLCLVDSGADHADLTSEYAAITEELYDVCALFDRRVLRELPEEEFLASLPEVRRRCGDRAALRALHVYGENRRVPLQADALRRGDFAAFLKLLEKSGRSSAEYLQNISPLGAVAQQELMLTLAVCERALEGEGAYRVHGGGFGGAAQVFLPTANCELFARRIEALLGANRCRFLSLRSEGGIRL